MKLSSFTLKTLVQSIADALNLRPTKTEVDAKVDASTAATATAITNSKNLITSAITASEQSTQSFINTQNNTLTTYIYTAADDVKASVDNSKFFIEGVVNSAADSVKTDLSTSLNGVQTYLDSAIFSSRSYLDNLIYTRFNQSDDLQLQNKGFILTAVDGVSTQLTTRANTLDSSIATLSSTLTTRATAIDTAVAGVKTDVAALPASIITQIKALRSGQLQLLSNDTVTVPADATLASGVNLPVQVQTSGNATAVNWRTSINFTNFTTLDYFYGAINSAGYTGSNIAVFQSGSFYFMVMLGYFGISPNILKLDSSFNVVDAMSYATSAAQAFFQTAFMYNNEIYLVMNSSNAALQLYKFNPTTGVTTTLASVVQTNQGRAVVVPDLTVGKVYFYGGRTTGNAIATIKTTYDIATNTFTQPAFASIGDFGFNNNTGLYPAPTGIRFLNKVHVCPCVSITSGTASLFLYSEVTGNVNYIPSFSSLSVPSGFAFPSSYNWISNIFTTDGIHLFIKAGTVPDISGTAAGAWLKYVVNSDLTLTLVGPVDFGDFYVNNQPVTTNMIPLRIWNYTVMNGCTLFYKGTRVNAVYPVLTMVKVADVLTQKYSYFVRYN